MVSGLCPLPLKMMVCFFLERKPRCVWETRKQAAIDHLPMIFQLVYLSQNVAMCIEEAKVICSRGLQDFYQFYKGMKCVRTWKWTECARLRPAPRGVKCTSQKKELRTKGRTINILSFFSRNDPVLTVINISHFSKGSFFFWSLDCPTFCKYFRISWIRRKVPSAQMNGDAKVIKHKYPLKYSGLDPAVLFPLGAQRGLKIELVNIAKFYL